jgi:hypothetical protein
MLETQEAIDRHSADPEGAPLQETPTLQYINLMFIAARVVHRYTTPMPGSVVFVLPDSARAVAESLADEIIDEGIFGEVGRARRRHLVKFLTFYFGLAEAPLKAESSRELLAELNGLGLSHMIATNMLLNEAYPDDPPFDTEPVEDALAQAEARRAEVIAQSQNKAPRKKRDVRLPRIRDLLQ